MAQNFLESCEVAEILVGQSHKKIDADRLDTKIIQAGIDTYNEPGDLIKYLQAEAGVDSLTLIEGVEAAEGCETCQNNHPCRLGELLKVILPS